MITCNFSGELGNNLFQLATLINLSKQYNYEYCIPDYRNFWNSSINNKLEINELFSHKFEYKNLDVKKYVHTDSLEYANPNFSHRYNEIPIISDNTQLNGHFQSKKYFKNIQLDLKSIYFKFDDHLIEYVRSLYNINFKKTAILHVRHGRDRYKNCQYAKSFSQFNDKYYKNSTSYLSSNYDIENLLVISDDIEWVKTNIKIENLIYVEHNSNIEDFVLFSLCKYNILGNSTFSWWASFLNIYDDCVKIIPPPNEYFKKGSVLYKCVDVQDMYDDSFKIMKTD